MGNTMVISHGVITCPCGWNDTFTPPLVMTSRSFVDGHADRPFIHCIDSAGKVVDHNHRNGALTKSLTTSVDLGDFDAYVRAQLEAAFAKKFDAEYKRLHIDGGKTGVPMGIEEALAALTADETPGL